jgi:hypothetical protein
MASSTTTSSIRRLHEKLVVFRVNALAHKIGCSSIIQFENVFDRHVFVFFGTVGDDIMIFWVLRTIVDSYYVVAFSNVVISFYCYPFLRPPIPTLQPKTRFYDGLQVIRKFPLFDAIFSCQGVGFVRQQMLRLFRVVLDCRYQGRRCRRSCDYDPDVYLIGH